MLDIQIIPALQDNYIYLLHDAQRNWCAVVDPADAQPVLNVLQQRQLNLNYILNSHHHHDHVGANLELKQRTGCRIIGAEADRLRIPGLDIGVGDEQLLNLNGITLRILATPGHTSGHIVFYLPQAQALFCGDTLFSLGCGRLFEGTAAQMRQSLQRITELPAETQIYCAHEYTAANAKFALSVEPDNAELLLYSKQIEQLRRENQSTLPSTLGRELACNPFLRCDSATIRAQLGLDAQADAVEVLACLRRRKDVFS
jgi:hydroxyacylglutathione hydrolase